MDTADYRDEVVAAMLRKGLIPSPSQHAVIDCVRSGKSVVIFGGPCTGKTAVVDALCEAWRKGAHPIKDAVIEATEASYVYTPNFKRRLTRPDQKVVIRDASTKLLTPAFASKLDAMCRAAYRRADPAAPRVQMVCVTSTHVDLDVLASIGFSAIKLERDFELKKTPF